MSTSECNVSALPSGNDPSAYMAALNIVKSCLSDHTKGITFRGEPMIKFDDRAKRLNFMHLQETVGDVQNEMQRLITRQLPHDDVPLAPAPNIAAADAIVRPTGKASAKAKGKGNAKGNANKREAAELTGAEEAAKKRKKELAASVQAAIKAKSAAMIICADVHDLSNKIATHEDYSILSQPKTLKLLREPRDALEAFKKSSDFWELCFSSQDVLKALKTKNFDDAYIAKECARIGELTMLTDKVNGASLKLKKIQQDFMFDEDA